MRRVSQRRKRESGGGEEIGGGGGLRDGDGDEGGGGGELQDRGEGGDEGGSEGGVGESEGGGEEAKEAGAGSETAVAIGSGRRLTRGTRRWRRGQRGRVDDKSTRQLTATERLLPAATERARAEHEKNTRVNLVFPALIRESHYVRFAESKYPQ